MEGFWEGLAACRDVAETTPADRWDADVHYSQQGAKSGTYARFGAYCADVVAFDAAYFRLPASEALALDPHTRLLLTLAQVWPNTKIFEADQFRYPVSGKIYLVADSGSICILLTTIKTSKFGRLQCLQCPRASDMLSGCICQTCQIPHSVNEQAIQSFELWVLLRYRRPWEMQRARSARRARQGSSWAACGRTSSWKCFLSWCVFGLTTLGFRGPRGPQTLKLPIKTYALLSLLRLE